MPAQDRVRGEDGREFPQSLAADGISLHREESTLVIVEQQSLLSELLEQRFDLSILELNDLLLTWFTRPQRAASRRCNGWRMQNMFGAENRSVSGADG